MGLFIDRHFLFEIQLLYLSVHMEVFSFEDSEWNRGHYKMECHIFYKHTIYLHLLPSQGE